MLSFVIDAWINGNFKTYASEGQTPKDTYFLFYQNINEIYYPIYGCYEL